MRNWEKSQFIGYTVIKNRRITIVEMITMRRIEEYRNYLIQDEKSAVTIEKYCRDVQRFMAYVNGREITKEVTVSYKKALENENYAIRSINSMLASINSFLRFVGLENCRVKSLRCQRQIYCPEEKELTRAEYYRLLEAAKHREQLSLVIQTICGTGIRISELKYFTVESVKSGEVTVRCKNKTRRILIPSKLRKLLMTFTKRRGIIAGPIFITRNGLPLDRSNIWAQMKRLCQKAGVNPSKVFPHNLRKLFARTFYGIEKDIAKLADILGHGSIETTRIYIMTTGTEHRKKIERLGLVI